MSTWDGYRKVNVARKTSYTYHTARGDITIHPDPESGVTIDIIQELHRADNREVENNLKQARRPMTDGERRDVEAWRKAGRDDEPPRAKGNFPESFQRWNLPLDGLRREDDCEDDLLDRDPALCRAFTSQEAETPMAVLKLREFIATLSKRQQEFYRLVYIENYTKAEAARIMGISLQRATTLDHQIRDNIEKRFNL